LGNLIRFYPFFEERTPNMDYDTDKVDDTTLALMALG
jgi:hypothetical protein